VLSLKHFSVPPEGFIKLSFDGASKGNLGSDGFGGLFRDTQAKIRLIYVEHYGYASKNEEKFAAVRNLLMASKLG